MTTTDTLNLDLAPPPGGQTLHHTDRATIIWGDCRDPTVIAQVPDWYGLLCTDPPYGVNWNSGTHHINPFGPIEGDDGTADWPGILAQWVGLTGTWKKGLGPSRHVYVFGYTPADLAGPLRLGATAELVWDKMATGLGDLQQPWGPGHERITFGAHQKEPAAIAAKRGSLSARLRRGSVLRVRRPSGRGVTRHPTEKPVALMSQLIESSTLCDDLVVDPCAGSGSTGVAAVLAGRRAFLVEYDRGYAELAAERVKAAEKIAALIASA